MKLLYENVSTHETKCSSLPNILKKLSSVWQKLMKHAKHLNLTHFLQETHIFFPKLKTLYFNDKYKRQNYELRSNNKIF